jgi:hypothetical protein
MAIKPMWMPVHAIADMHYLAMNPSNKHLNLYEIFTLAVYHSESTQLHPFG